MKNWLRNSFVLCLLTLSYHAVAAEVLPHDQVMLNAIMDRDVEGLLTVIETEADVNAKLPNGMYPIMVATESSSVEVLKLLTANNADVLVQDADSVSAMHLAARVGSVDKIKLLRALKAPTNSKDAEGVTPLYYAWKAGKLTAADYLIESENARVNVNDADGNPLAFWVVSQGDNEKIVEHMIKHKLNIFKRNKAGKSLLEVAQARDYKKSAAVLQQAYDQKLKAYQDQLNKKQQAQ